MSSPTPQAPVPPRGTIALLGSTGRLGPAIVRALGPDRVHGLSRRAPGADETPAGRFVQADRRDPAALRAVVDGAEAVVDLLAFDEADAACLLEAVAAAARPPRHLVFVSSVAELDRPPGTPGAGAPDGAMGRGKRAARRRYEADFPGVVHTLVIPRLVAEVDPGLRDRAYLESAAGGRVLVAGDGAQRQTVAPVEGVAEVVRRLLADPGAVPPGPIPVGPPTPLPLSALVEALLEGAGVKVPLARHPDPGWRGPHGGGDEILDTAPLEAALPGLAWPDVLATCRRHGAWLVRHLPEAARPRASVRKPHQSFRGHGVVDVHGSRDPAVVAEPIPELAELVGWLAPAFYLDTGRPCNAACLYCAVSPHADTEGFTPLARVDGMIAAGRAAGAARAILIGGEPTIHPHLDGILGRLAEAGFAGDHVVMTNGLRLAEDSVIDGLIRGGVRTFHVSIDTADPAVYRRLGRGLGRLATQQAALDRLLARRDLNLYVYACVTRLNAEGLPALLEDVARRADAAGRPPPPVVLAFAKPVGDGLTHADVLIPEPASRGPLARAAVAEGRRLGIPVGLRNLQSCLAPDLVAHNMDYYVEDYSVDLARRARVPYAHASYWRQGVPCHGCADRAVCTGIYADDLDRFGAGAFSPLAANPALAASAAPASAAPGGAGDGSGPGARAPAAPALALRLTVGDKAVTLQLVSDPERRGRHLAWALGHGLSYQGSLDPGRLRDTVLALGRAFSALPATPRDGGAALEALRSALATVAGDAVLEGSAAAASPPAARRRTAGWMRRGRPSGAGIHPFDAEVAALDAGLRRLIKREPLTGAEAEAERAWLEGAGLRTLTVTGAEGTPVVLAARDAALLEAAAIAERGLAGPEGATHARWLGDALGYPPCCVDAYLGAPTQDDEGLMDGLLPPPGRPPAPAETQWLAPPLALVSHAPCALTCPASLGLGVRILAALEAAHPGFEARWRPLAARLQVAHPDGRIFALALDGAGLEGARILDAVEVRPLVAEGAEPLTPAPALAGHALRLVDGRLHVEGPQGFVARFVADHRGARPSTPEGPVG